MESAARTLEAIKSFFLLPRKGYNLFVEVVVATFVFGLAAHAFCYFNLMYSHDSLISITRGSGGMLSFGRFMQAAYLAVRGVVAAPWLIGLLSLVFLALACYFVLKLFEPKYRVPSLLVVGLMVTNIVVTATNATYIHDADYYMLSLALATMAAYAIQKRTGLSLVLGVCLLVLSMGLYQAYMNVTVVLLIASSIKDVLEGHSTKTCIKGGLLSLAVLLAGFLLYYLCMRLSLLVTHVEAGTGYNGVANLGDYSQVSFMGLLASSWTYTLAYVLNPEGMHVRLQVASYGILAAAALFMLVALAKRQKRTLSEVVLIALLILLLPLGANLAYVASKGVVHTLMLYGIFLYAPLVLLLGDLYLADAVENRGIGKLQPAHVNETNLHAVASGITPSVALPFGAVFPVALASALCAVLIMGNIQGANQAYVLKQLQFEATESLMTRVLDRVEQTQGYVAGETPVLFVGALWDSPLFKQRSGFEGVPPRGFFSESSITYDVKPWIHKLWGYNMNTVRATDVKSKVPLAVIEQTEPFPAKESCVFVGDILLVKLANEFDDDAKTAYAKEE